MNLFVSAAITKKDFLSVAKGTLPFLILMFLTLFLITYIPAISLMLTTLITN
jgi:C4-dicarboxylate transporter DctM subunit